MVKATVVGASGFTAKELVKILLSHPNVEIKNLVSKGNPGKPFSSLHPEVPLSEKMISLQDTKDSDICFLCLPHTESQKYVPFFLRKGTKIIDLSADFRLQSSILYKKWYKKKHLHPELLKKAVYGLPELYSDKIKNADLVANPGCYATAVLLALLPLLAERKVKQVIVSATSGVSGAGRRVEQRFHFTNIYENIFAYAVSGHRHIPEIEQEMRKIQGKKITFLFIPQVAGTERGILVCCFLKPYSRIKDPFSLYRRFYQDKPFVQILPKESLPETKQLVGRNSCQIGLSSQAGWLIVVSALDNLIKGASGQAVQNMNVMFGFNEKTGLKV